MPTTQASLLTLGISLTVLKAAILLILVFYAIFSLIIIRQVDLMSKTLISDVSSVVKAFAIIHAGFALGLIALVWGML